MSILRRRLLDDTYKQKAIGNPINVKSVARMYPEITIQGRTEQKATTGANLFDVQSDIDLFQHPDSFIKSEGNKIVVKAWAVPFIKEDKAKELFPLNSVRTFKFKVVKKENGIGTTLFSDRLGFLLYNKTKSATIDLYCVNNLNETGKEAEFSKTFTISETAYGDSDEINLYVYTERYLDDNEVEDFSVCEFYDIMISESDVPYEPYTGGRPSPSPDYPWDIINAGRWNEDTRKWEYGLFITGKNLYSDGDKERLNTRYETDFIPWTGKSSVYVNADTKGTTDSASVYVSILYYDANKVQHGSNGFETTVGTEWTHIQIQFSGTNALDGEDVDLKTIKFLKMRMGPYTDEYQLSLKNIMLSDENIEFTGYQKPQTVTLTSDRPLTKWDRLEKRDGVWGWVYNSMIANYNGTEDWKEYDSDNTKYSFMLYIGDMLYDGFCSSFIPFKSASEIGTKDGVYFLSTSNIIITLSGVNSLDEWKRHLSDNPIEIVARNDKNEFIPLSESEQQVLNALHTYYPTTVITNDQGCEMEVTYKTRKSLGGNNVLDLNRADIAFGSCIKLTYNSVRSNIKDVYFCNIFLDYVSNDINNGNINELIFSCKNSIDHTGISIILYGTFKNDDPYRESYDEGNEVVMEIPDDLIKAERIELRFNRSGQPFTDTTTIIKDLCLIANKRR